MAPRRWRSWRRGSWVCSDPDAGSAPWPSSQSPRAISTPGAPTGAALRSRGGRGDGATAYLAATPHVAPPWSCEFDSPPTWPSLPSSLTTIPPLTPSCLALSPLHPNPCPRGPPSPLGLHPIAYLLTHCPLACAPWLAEAEAGYAQTRAGPSSLWHALDAHVVRVLVHRP